MKIELHKKYSIKSIIDFCDKNNLITVDCLKEENMISLEEYNNGELGDCIYEFKKTTLGFFKLTWADKNYFAKSAGQTCEQSARV